MQTMGSTENQPKSKYGTTMAGNVTHPVTDRSPTVASNTGSSNSSHRCGAAVPTAHGAAPGSMSKSDTTSDSDYDESIIHKTILVGDSGVGKTSLLVQFDQKKFQPGSFAATVGIGFTNKVVTVDGAKVKLQIWDTAGQERFRSITHAYYRDAHALLLLYDVTSKTSFDNISAWLAEINEYAQDDVVIMLIGNKADMNGERAVKKEEGIGVAKDYGVSFMETSAKTGQNVESAFMSIASDLKQKKTRGQARYAQPGMHISSEDSPLQSTITGASSAFSCCS